jgi:hypothetical protein
MLDIPGRAGIGPLYDEVWAIAGRQLSARRSW